MNIKPGTLFRSKVRFYQGAGTVVLPDEIFMYLESELLEDRKYFSLFYRHKFLSKNGKMLWWTWKNDIEDFVEFMSAEEYFERVEL